MKLVGRIAAIATVFLVSLVASAVVLIYFNQHRIVVAVLTSIKNQSGVEIISPSSRIRVTTRWQGWRRSRPRAAGP